MTVYSNSNSLCSIVLARLVLFSQVVRISHWVKNLLLFLPVFFFSGPKPVDLFWVSIASFFSFSLIASSGYIFNDIVDAEADRLHLVKKQRPFASYKIDLRESIFLFMLTLTGGLAVSFLFLNWKFTACLIAYVFLAFSYSLFLKRILFFDAFVLSFFYVLRILAGGFAFGIAIQGYWAFFAFCFFSNLALIKRRNEIAFLDSRVKSATVLGRGYQKAHSRMVASLAILVLPGPILVLICWPQLFDRVNLGSNSLSFWLGCLIALILLLRVWFIAGRGLLIENPFLFAYRDRISLALGTILSAFFWNAFN